MTGSRARIIALWLAGIAAALWVVVHARYITDLSAFLPAKPTPMQELLVDQLRDGPASRLILIALEGGGAEDRARLSAAMARRLRQGPEFDGINNGESLAADRDREFLFQHRYLLSDAVDSQHFSVAGLRAAIADTIENLESSAGFALKSLIPRDPTGEMLRIVDQLAATQGPHTQGGVWVSQDGARTLLVAQTAAPGSDTDAQERALDAIRAAFNASLDASAHGGAAADGAPGSSIHLRTSGPGVFAVAARAKIKQAAMRLSIISSILVVGVLLTVYRSVPALILGLLPVISGALAGIATVALGFGVVHGVTLGFGITLIGESVDYSIYFFIQSLRKEAGGAAPQQWRKSLWPTIRLGMLTSVCGFASLLPSGFPGLAQLGLYSISGLAAAALVTRFVLPELLPRGFVIRDLAPLGLRLGRLRDSLRGLGGRVIGTLACALAIGALLVILQHKDVLWNRELSSLSPISPEDQRYDARLRADLGTANVLDLVVVSGPNLEAVLQGAERIGTALQPLIDAKVISGFDSPANYLPSLDSQQERRNALPDPNTLRANLSTATRDLDLQDSQLAEFVSDVEAARHGSLLTASDLEGTSLDAGFEALILRRAGRWSALLPLHAAPGAHAAGGGANAAGDTGNTAGGVDTSAADIDIDRVRAAVSAAALNNAQVLDLKQQTDMLYADYLHEAMRLSAAGFALIVILLLAVLRSPARVARVLAPLGLAVLIVAAVLAAFGRQLTILHLVGMLLIVAVGSNYALFFDKEGSPARGEAFPLTLASLALANVCTVIGFGLLSFSQVPVLEALGMTVAPGAFLALLFSALLTSSAAPPRPKEFLGA